MNQQLTVTKRDGRKETIDLEMSRRSGGERPARDERSLPGPEAAG